MLAIQSEGEGTGSVYLEDGLGGIGPGFAASIQFPVLSRVALNGDVVIWTIKGHQTGRLVPGDGDVRHQETLVSALCSVRLPTAPPSELTAGAGWSFGRPSREIPIDNVGGMALTVGLDVVGRVSQHLAVVTSVKYSFVDRGQDNIHVGLGPHVIRIGIGLRFGPFSKSVV